MAASVYHVISKEVENQIKFLETIAFLDAHVYIDNPYWQSCGIIISLCKYYIVISDTVIGLDVFFLSPAVILSELDGKRRRKD